MPVLTVGGGPGSPVAGPVDREGQRHDPVVPTAAGEPPWCSCGWTQPAPRGPFLHEHLADVRAAS